jgi:hypothetical protein
MSSVQTGLLILIFAVQSLKATPLEEYQRGKNAFDRGEFGRAVEILGPLLYPEPRLQSGQKIVEAHRLLGVAYLFQKQDQEARKEFRKLLQIRPDYRLDPLLFPPEVVDFFNAVRREHGAELSSLEARRASAEKRAKEDCENARAEPVVVEKRLLRNSYYVNFIPFGAGQFQNSQRSKGWAFFAGQVTLGAISLSAQIANLALYGLRPTRACQYDLGRDCPSEYIDHRAENRARWLTRVQIGAGVLFFASVGWGIIDAISYYQPETVMAKNSARLPRLTSHKFVPIPVGDTYGPGLFFRF